MDAANQLAIAALRSELSGTAVAAGEATWDAAKVVTGWLRTSSQNGLPEPSRLQNIFHPSNTTLTIAKPVSSHVAAFGMTFENQAGSAFSAPFRWQA